MLRAAGGRSAFSTAPAPSSRPPLTTSGPSDRQYRGWPSRQFRQNPHHGQPITTLSPTATIRTSTSPGPGSSISTSATVNGVYSFSNIAALARIAGAPI
jgi:hypothetical protein